MLVLAVFFALGRTYIRRQTLRNIQKRGLSEAATFFTLSRELDAANGAALNFIMEVELVARGYRLSTPIPPISRLEGNGQNVKCMQLRTAVRLSLLEVLPKYYQTALAVWGFAEQFQLAQLQSQYQFTLADVVERYQQLDLEVDVGQESEKIQSLKDLAFLFHDIRKVFLGGILALHTDGSEADRLRYTTISEAFIELNEVTKRSLARVREVLAGTEMPTIVKTPRTPQSPRHDQWHSQVRRLSSMTMNIRSVQAKLHLLREESARSLDSADDISDLGPMFMSQYESIGQDLRDLMDAWQSGKATLASGINRNEKRISSIGSVLTSPSSTLSGLTIAEEGDDSQDEKDGVEAALRKLNGNMTPPDVEPEVFEAISLPRPRSMLSREERIIKM
ncbi:Mysoin-binding motif of peroxisomes-domain-containing protein, partial [Microdochium bolleyi]